MATEDGVTFQPEAIPDSDTLFRQTPDYRFWKDGTLRPAGFKPKGGGVSCDWSRYSTAAESLARAPEAIRFMVAALSVAWVRGISLPVKHTPTRGNRAHSDIICGDDEEIRMALSRMAAPIPDAAEYDYRHTNNP